MHVSLISPERKLFEGEAESVSLPGSYAPFTVLSGHAPIISDLSAGKVQINTGSELLQFVVDSGFVEVSDNHVSALVESALSPAEIDVAAEEENLRTLSSTVVEGDVEIDALLKKAELSRQKIRAAVGVK